MVLATHDNPSGSSRATNQLWVPGVPGYGGVQVPSTVDGVVVMLHSGVTVIPVVPSLLAYQVLAPGLYALANNLVAANWAVLWPSYPEEGQGNVVPIQALINDLESATSSSGQQLATTTGNWWDDVLTCCGRRWPGKKIAVAGWSEGAFMALKTAALRPGQVIGGIAHEPATIWGNVVDAPFNFTGVSSPNYDLSATALDAVTEPFLVGYGTNDMTVGYSSAGTGGTPVSNTQAMIAAAGANISANSTADTHEMTGTDVTTYTDYFASTLAPLR